MANLLIIGFSREQVSERGYEFALALRTEQQQAGESHVSAMDMVLASELVKNAQPGAYRIYELRQRMH